jgi:NAD(P)-dependent dehydrogenase (short-subunit alcohol dehydrogenase family)
MNLKEKVAVVAGGTGELGRAVVREFLAAGVRVAVPVRKQGGLEAIRKDLGLDRSSPLLGSVVDTSEEAAVAAFFSKVTADLGGVDFLVNAAGAFAGGKPVHQTSWSVWQQMLDANLKSAVLASRAAVPEIAKRGGGAIINVSSRPAVGSGENLAAYAASKRAVLALTDAMAAELTSSRIAVNAVLPSTIDTPANRKAMPAADFSKWTKPEDIARVILFLAGPDGRIVTGAHIPV